MNYLELSISVPSLAAEAIAYALTEAGVPGVVLAERTPDAPPSETTDVKAYLPEVEGAPSLQGLREEVRRALAAYDPEATFEVATRRIPEEDWATSWKQFWHVQRIGDRLVVRPSWEEYEAQERDVVITLDPKMAFGTGTHPTTRLCMRAIERLAAEGPLGEVFDVGGGSGILAIAAILLGAPRAVVVDTDPVAVASAQENAEINHVEDRMESKLGSTDVLEGTAPIVFANILAEVIIDLARDLYARTAPGGRILASGIIERKAEDVEKALTSVGYTLERRDSEGEWVGLVAQRPQA